VAIQFVVLHLLVVATRLPLLGQPAQFSTVLALRLQALHRQRNHSLRPSTCRQSTTRPQRALRLSSLTYKLRHLLLERWSRPRLLQVHPLSWLNLFRCLQASVHRRSYHRS